METGNILIGDDLTKEKSLHPSTLNLPNALSLETLLTINDQNNEKLKLTLRRLSRYESELTSLKKIVADKESEISNLNDQLYLITETDLSAKKQLQKTAEELEIYKTQFQLIEQKLKNQTSELTRLQKYHTKIQNHVKPVFTQLKEYSKNLEIQNQKLSDSNTHKDIQVKELRKQLTDVIKNFQTQLDLENSNKDKLIDNYEAELTQLRNHVTKIQDELNFANSELEKCSDYFSKLSEFENQNISLNRLITEKSIEISNLKKEFDAGSSVLKRDSFKHESENKDLRITLNLLNNENKTLKNTHYDLEKQLESLKFIWSQKNKECEKLQAALKAQEEINLELSRQLLQQRSLQS